MGGGGADDIQRGDPNVSRADAEQHARCMLASEHKSHLPFDPDVEGDVDRWLAYAAEEIAFSEQLSHAEAEQRARQMLASMGWKSDPWEERAIKDTDSAGSDRREDCGMRTRRGSCGPDQPDAPCADVRI